MQLTDLTDSRRSLRARTPLPPLDYNPSRMDDPSIDRLRDEHFPEEWRWSRQVIESVSSGVTISSAVLPGFPLIYVNPAFEIMTGYSPAECLGRNCRFLQGTEHDQPGLVKIRTALREGTDTSTVLRNFRKDGTLFHNELYLSTIRDPYGRVTHFVGIQNDVTARVELQAQLSYMSQHDMLTGLVNRAVLMESIERALKARQPGRHLAVFFLDLDNFKSVNDMFGHREGDRLLKTIAERIHLGVRHTETSARLGGDEFVLLVENLKDEKKAEDVMQRIASQVGQPTLVCGETFIPAASIGMALAPRDGNTAEALLRTADTAMYLQKHLRQQDDRAEAPSQRSARTAP